jgi:hypothetical protein
MFRPGEARGISLEGLAGLKTCDLVVDPSETPNVGTSRAKENA